MDQLAEQIGCVADHFNVKQFIGLGVGFGANILLRYAISCPKRVLAVTAIGGCHIRVSTAESIWLPLQFLSLCVFFHCRPPSQKGIVG